MKKTLKTISLLMLSNAATLEINGIERLFKVILPAASPAILPGCLLHLNSPLYCL